MVHAKDKSTDSKDTLRENVINFNRFPHNLFSLFCLIMVRFHGRMYSEYSLIHCNWFGGILADSTDFSSRYLLSFIAQFVLYTSPRNSLRIRMFALSSDSSLSVITNFCILLLGKSTLCYIPFFALYKHNVLTLDGLSVTEAHTKVLIGMQKNG